ncbi:MAG: metallophosphoesterase [Deltaproteobacteria bacterium]|nr:metallophosphoesterase [Deltaproteobacteria bacterium]
MRPLIAVRHVAPVAVVTAIAAAIALGCAHAPPPPAPGLPAPYVVLPKAGPLRLLVLGDTGKGSDGQRRVAEAARQVCAAERGCHLGLLLGDNLYPNGLDDEADPRWTTLVEEPYRALGIPFLAVLGNHDYGAPIPTTFCGGLGLEERRAEAQIARSRRSFVHLPDRHWRMRVGDVELVGLDTQALFHDDLPALAGPLGMRDDARRQDEALRRWNAEPRARFRIALGHHPWRSAGPHGDAGAYEGIPVEGLLFSGGAIRRFLDARVIGRFDLYLAGHDHGLQDAGDERGTALFVSGGGGEHVPHPARRPVPFAAESLGFVLVDVEGTTARVRIYGVPDEGAPAARVLHERTVAR